MVLFSSEDAEMCLWKKFVLLIQINLERLRFDSVKEDLIEFALKEDLIQIYCIQYLPNKEDLYFMKRVNLDVLV